MRLMLCYCWPKWPNPSKSINQYLKRYKKRKMNTAAIRNIEIDAPFNLVINSPQQEN